MCKQFHENSRLQNELQNELQNYLHELSIDVFLSSLLRQCIQFSFILKWWFFLKLVISKLRLHVTAELNFKEKVILRCSFFNAKDDDLDSSFDLKTVTNFIKFLWFIISCNDWSFFFNLFLSVKCDVTRSKWADAENQTFESEVVINLAVVDLAVLNNVDKESSLKFENLDYEDGMKRSTSIVSSFFSSDIVN